jgi:hypothetical protein
MVLNFAHLRKQIINNWRVLYGMLEVGGEALYVLEIKNYYI